MRKVNLEEQSEEEKFALRAAETFASDPETSSFSDNEPSPGSLLAIRWGLLDDCVLVLKLDPTHDPTNYVGLVKVVSK